MSIHHVNVAHTHIRDEVLYGFVLSYERVSPSGWFAFELAKPFFWNETRFDTPVDLLFKAPVHHGRWEWFVGAGATLSIRRFSGERVAQEGHRVVVSPGALFGTGVSVTLRPSWVAELSLDYAIVFEGAGVLEHEVVPAVGVGFVH